MNATTKPTKPTMAFTPGVSEDSKAKAPDERTRDAGEGDQVQGVAGQCRQQAQRQSDQQADECEVLARTRGER